MELAPSDDELRYKVALDFERRDMIPEAIAIIRPLAYPASAAASDESAGERRRARGSARTANARPARPGTRTAREMLAAAGGAGSAADRAPAPDGLTAQRLRRSLRQQLRLALEPIGIAAGVPSVRMTRWQGISTATLLAPLAVPAARTAAGRPTAAAIWA